MEITELMQIGIVGVILSVIMEGIKIKFGPVSYATKAITVLLAVILGGLYVSFQGTEIGATIVTILAAASTVYAFLFK